MIDYDRYRVGENDEILVLEVTGKLDNTTSPYFFECVESEIEDGSTRIVLDFDQLEHISSLGLGMLVRVHSRMKGHGGDVKFARVGGLAAEVVSSVGLNRLFQFYPSLEDACKAFGS